MQQSKSIWKIIAIWSIVASLIVFSGNLGSNQVNAASYDRNAAYSYAEKYAYKVCSDGYFYEKTWPPSYLGAGVPVPSGGYDCAHFVSCCIGSEPNEQGGGLDVPSRTGVEYGEPGAKRLGDLLLDNDIGREVSSIDELEKGDVINYDWDGDGHWDHAAIYLGNNKVAAHSTSVWGASWNLGGAARYRFIHISSDSNQILVQPSDGSYTERIYWLQNNKLYHVLSPDIINKMSSLSAWSTVYKYPSSELSGFAGWPDGVAKFIDPNNPQSDGILIQQEGDGTVFITENGKRLGFTDPEALTFYGALQGYGFDDVITVTQAIMGMYDDGDVICFPGQNAPNPQLFKDCYNRVGGYELFGMAYNDVHSWGNGLIQDFRKNGNLLAIMKPNSKKEAYAIYGAIWAKYKSLGNPPSFLGYPTSDEREADQSGAEGFNTQGRVQDFEHGILVYHRTGSRAGDTFETHSDIYHAYIQEGASGSWLGFPTSDVYNDSSYPRGDFEGGYITTRDGINYQACPYTPPSTPTLYSISNPSCGNYTVSWSSVSGAISYTLEEKKDSGSWQQVYSGSSTQKSFSKTNDGKYCYRVKAISNCGDTSWSGEKCATVIDGLSIPTLNPISDASCGNYTVSWSSVSGATSYTLEEKKDSGSWQQVYSGSGTQKSFSDKEKGTYCYRVKATNACGDSSWSSERCATVTGEPDTPTLYSIENSDRDGNYTVSWGSVSNATGYTLQEKKDDGSWTDIYSGPNTQWSPPSAKPDGTYCYRVRASNSCGDSSWSDEKCAPVGDDLVADAGADKTICHPNNGGTHSVQIGGNPTASGGTPDYEYNWSPNTGLNNTSIANPTANPTTTTTYTVTVTDANNDTATDSVTVLVNPELIANAGEDRAINKGESTTIGGSPTASGGTPPYEYRWTPSTGLNNPNIANPVASPDKPGIYIYTVTVANAIECQDSDSVTVFVDGDPCFYVDIDCDCDVDIFDILEVAKHWGCEVGDACYDKKCDVINDGEIDIFDILEVAKHWGDNVCTTAAPSLIAIDETSYSATVRLQASTPKVTVGDSFNVEILASLPYAVQAFEFKIAYGKNAYAQNQPVVRFETYEGDNLLTDKNGNVIHLGPKINRVRGTIAYGGIFLSKNVNGKSSGRLANLRFTALLPGECQVAISDIKLVSSDYNLIPIRITNPIKLHIKPKPPKQSALLQNYPNPFNPETWIPYQLTEADDVKIHIYDVSGRLVRILDLGYKDAGYYQDKASAVYWDGKNEAGEKSASGVYFYSIKAGNYTATRKMLLME